jgi:hypothetical protein
MSPGNTFALGQDRACTPDRYAEVVEELGVELRQRPRHVVVDRPEEVPEHRGNATSASSPLQRHGRELCVAAERQSGRRQDGIDEVAVSSRTEASGAL